MRPLQRWSDNNKTKCRICNRIFIYIHVCVYVCVYVCLGNAFSQERNSFVTTEYVSFVTWRLLQAARYFASREYLLYINIHTTEIICVAMSAYNRVFSSAQLSFVEYKRRSCRTWQVGAQNRGKKEPHYIMTLITVVRGCSTSGSIREGFPVGRKEIIRAKERRDGRSGVRAEIAR